MLNCAARDESVLFHNAHTGDTRGVDVSGLVNISPIRGHCCVQPTFPYLSYGLVARFSSLPSYSHKLVFQRTV
jgi:hypothetical protein